MHVAAQGLYGLLFPSGSHKPSYGRGLQSEVHLQAAFVGLWLYAPNWASFLLNDVTQLW